MNWSWRYEIKPFCPTAGAEREADVTLEESACFSTILFAREAPDEENLRHAGKYDGDGARISKTPKRCTIRRSAENGGRNAPTSHIISRVNAAP